MLMLSLDPFYLACASKSNVVDLTTGTSFSSSAVAGWRFKVLAGCTNCEFPGQIFLEDFSKVGESVVRHRHSQPLEVECQLSLIILMIDWTGSNQRLE